MFTKLRLSLCFLALLMLPCNAENIFDILITNDKNIENKILFLDKLQECKPYKYHAEPSGIYLVNGVKNQACVVKWTLADCNFPEGVYQEFARVQKQRIADKVLWMQSGILIDLKDKNYRYLYDTGNKYCKMNYLR